MPGSVNAANPTAVMPYSLATVFQQTRTYTVQQNQYRDGSVQSRAIGDTVSPTLDSRRSWEQTKLLNIAELQALRAFYNQQQGNLIEFIMYDVDETDPPYSYDESGSALAGRYVVRFDGEFKQSLQLGRSLVSGLKLIEVA